MTDKIIQKKEFSSVLKRLQEGYQVFAPVKTGDFHNFQDLGEGGEPDFNFSNTRLSPKGLIQPQSEKMFEYSLANDDPEKGVVKEIQHDTAKRAIVGIRPCDAKAVELVKVNFETKEYTDPYWKRLHDATTFVGLACNNPCSTCFCSSTGSGPFHEEGLDVLLVDEGENYLAKPLTEKGQAVLEAAGISQDAASGDVEKVAALKKQAEAEISSTVPTEKLRENSLNELFNAGFWEDVAFSCINCGTCTYLCPTCWCFDIQDEQYDAKGIRLRNWDACMFPLFTLHGSGHNPRNQKTQRVRQRFMHKLKYYVDKYENGPACVGCGRCVMYCPVNIDIRRVFRLMNDFTTAG
jgi:sulfhydrogenase subunit beta (sulfur reductase)